MKFSDIPKFTRSAPYVVNQPWDLLQDILDHYINDYGLDLNPDFQRSHVWSIENRQAFVLFLLKGGHSSRDIYFNHPNWMNSFKTTPENGFVLVDGKQRLESVRMFLNNELSILGGHYFKDFEDRMGMFGAQFIFHVNDLPTRKEVLQWYLDLNSGGVAHTEEELNKVRHLLQLEQQKRRPIK